MFNDFVTVVSIGTMLIGVLFSILLPKKDRRHDRALLVFVFGAAIFLSNYLYRNPESLRSVEDHLGVLLLSIVFAFIQVIKRS